MCEWDNVAGYIPGRERNFDAWVTQRYLEVLAADKARVHVDWTERHRAALFKVKIQILHSNTSSSQRCISWG